MITFVDEIHCLGNTLQRMACLAHFDRDPTCVARLTKCASNGAMIDHRLTKIDKMRLTDMEVTCDPLASANRLNRVVPSQVDTTGVQMKSEARGVHGNNQIDSLSPIRNKITAISFGKWLETKPDTVNSTPSSSLAKKWNRQAEGFISRKLTSLSIGWRAKHKRLNS